MEWTPDNWKTEQAKAVETAETSVTRYRTDAIVNRNWPSGKAPPEFNEATRGAIGSEPSARSLQNLVFLLNNSDVVFETMLTLTLGPVCNQLPVEVHRKNLKAALEKLRRRCVSQYCWVREFQANESVHWHIFVSGGFDEVSPGAIHEDESRKWSRWWANVHRKHGVLDERELGFMANGDGASFLGCVRIERLRTEAGGRYAGKEGAKRFQKRPPAKWQAGGGAWWRASRGVKCTPIETVEIPSVELKSAAVTINNEPRDIAYRLQYGLGLKLKEN